MTPHYCCATRRKVILAALNGDVRTTAETVLDTALKRKQELSLEGEDNCDVKGLMHASLSAIS